MPAYLEQVFGPDGILASKFKHYQPRDGQLKLAAAVDQSLRGKRHLLAEAPTGTGKSLGYCVPAIHHAVHEKRKVVIATANILLQEQLVKKDLPFLQKVLPWKFEFALQKGMQNYLCRSEAEMGRFQLETLGDDDATRLLKWAAATKTGDRSELPFEPDHKLWQLVSRNSEACTGTACSFHESCFAQRAKRRAQSADIIVTNYHLLFAHLQVRQQTEQDLLLPSFDAVICDEAHQAAEIGRSFFGWQLSHRSILRLVSRLPSTSSLRQRVTEKSTAFFRDLYWYASSSNYSGRLQKTSPVSYSPLLTALQALAAHYMESLQMHGSRHLQTKAEVEQRREIEVIRNRVRTVAHLIRSAMLLQDGARIVYFIESTSPGRVKLCSRLIEVSSVLSSCLFEATPSVVGVSATLQTSGSFDFVKHELGVEDTDELVVDSPFSPKQTLLVVPEGLPSPNDGAFRDAVAETFAQSLEYSEGRTLGLFTSYKNLEATYQRIQGLPYRVLRQGQLPRAQLIEAFASDVRSVLLGTASFWEGVDVPGETLSCVVMDRLPFVAPGDPVMQALAARDKHWFRRHALPRAIVAFRQGFGRLIRRVDDRGVVVVLDTRLVGRSYGHAFLRSVPGVWTSRELATIRQFLGEVA